LEVLNPLSVLARGFSLTQRLPDRQIVVDSRQVAAGDRISTKLSRGSIISCVEEVSHEEESR
jgi:exodeoxyribonuclease VII large subunit